MTRFLLLTALVAPLVGCAEQPDPTFQYGLRLDELTFEVWSPDQGVHPDASILSHPQNPFEDGIGAETKWDVADHGPVPAFYGWATALVGIPTGEHQFLAANAAKSIYDLGLAELDDLPIARDIAVRGFQNVLEEFPDAVTFDGTGREAYELVTPAYLALEDLGGDIPAGWTLVENPDGSTAAVRRQE